MLNTPSIKVKPAPICFKGYEGQKEKIKSVPEWQERLGEFVDKLIQEVDKQ